MKPMSSRPRDSTSMVAGGAQRIRPVADGITEHQEPGALGLAREHGERDDRGRGHAGRGGMVLVDHDVEAEFVGEQPLVVIAVQQVGRDGGVLLAVGQVDAQRPRVLRPRREIGLLGELIDAHGDHRPTQRSKHGGA
jgi:hypothetical protein